MGYRGMGIWGNRIQGYGVQDTWAMGTGGVGQMGQYGTGGMGYRGMGIWGNRVQGHGVQDIWATWAMGTGV